MRPRGPDPVERHIVDALKVLMLSVRSESMRNRYRVLQLEVSQGDKRAVASSTVYHLVILRPVTRDLNENKR